MMELEKLSTAKPTTRCACGRAVVGAGLLPLADGSVHGPRECRAQRPREATGAEKEASAMTAASREDKVAWLLAEAARDREAPARELGERLRQRFGVGIGSAEVTRLVRQARGEDTTYRPRGTHALRSTWRRMAEKLFEQSPGRDVREVKEELRRAGASLGTRSLYAARYRARARLARAEKARERDAAPRGDVLSPAIRAALEPVKIAGAVAGLSCLLVSWSEDGTATIEWERHVVRSGKVTL